MKIIRHIFLAVLMSLQLNAVELQILKHKVIHNNSTYQRERADLRYCVWTNDQDKAIAIIKEFSIVTEDFRLQKGEVFAVFMNDTITQDLLQIVHNKTANETFADYASSGISRRLKAPEKGMKYSHVTAVIFTPIDQLDRISMRSMVHEGVSEKK